MLIFGYGALQDTIELCKSKLPNHIYSKELIELLFEQPYCKINFLVEMVLQKDRQPPNICEDLRKLESLKGSK